MKRKNIGILLIIGAAVGFAFMNLFVNLSGDLPTFQKAFFRNLIACIISSIIIIKNVSVLKTAKGNISGIFFRSFFGLLGVILNFYAISELNSISDASLLNKLSPFFAMIFSILILKEKAKKAEWLIVMLAFVGAVFVIKPSMSPDVIPALAGAFGGMFAGLAYTFVRKVTTNGTDGSVVVFAFSLFSTLALLPITLIEFQPMSGLQIFYLIMAGVSAAVGQYCITFAYKFAPAKEISVFDYTQVIFAAILGYFILGQKIDIFSVIGYIIIISAAVIRWRYNLKKAEN
ncbi:MAG: DMT family transporter [Acutalibacteraceae bacterium]|nr:DMT family transporter [Acutalibacteraceae bacterium]